MCVIHTCAFMHAHMRYILTHQLTECQLLLGHPMGTAPFTEGDIETQRGKDLPKMAQLDGGRWAAMPSMPAFCKLRSPLGVVSINREQLLANALKDFVFTLFLSMAINVGLGKIAKVCSAVLPVTGESALASCMLESSAAPWQGFFKEGQSLAGPKFLLMGTASRPPCIWGGGLGPWGSPFSWASVSPLAQ